jgi:hypothetical protein
MGLFTLGKRDKSYSLSHQADSSGNHEYEYSHMNQIRSESLCSTLLYTLQDTMHCAYGQIDEEKPNGK